MKEDACHCFVLRDWAFGIAWDDHTVDYEGFVGAGFQGVT